MIALTEDKLTVFYREQEKWDEAKVHADHALALRAKFLASGYAREAGFLVSQKDMAGAAALYQKALTTIDPPRPEQEDFRKEVEANLKTVSEFLPQPAPKPAAAPKRKQATPAR